MRKVLAIVAIMALLVSPIFANTVTKENSRGGTPVNVVTDSLQIMQIYPGQLINYGGFAAIELLGPVVGYCLLDIGEMGVIGIAGSPNPGYDAGGVLGATQYPITTVGTTPNNVISLLYGYDLGDMAAGIVLQYGADSNSTKVTNSTLATANDTTDVSKAYVGINAGVSVDNIDGAVKAVLTGSSERIVTYGTASNNVVATDDIETNSAMLIDVNVRGIFDAWIANLGFSMGSESGVFEDKDDSNLDGDFADAGENDKTTGEDSTMSVALLVANNQKVTDTIALIIGTGLTLNMNKTAITKTEDLVAGTIAYTPAAYASVMQILMPIYVSLVCNINETWSFIGGVSTNFINMTNTTNSTQAGADGALTENNTASRNIMDNGLTGALGVSGKFGDVTIDLNINPTILTNGLFFINGVATNPLALSAALSYSFSK